MPQWIHTLTVDASYHFPTRVTGIGIVVQERLRRSGRGPIVDRIAEAHLNVPAGAGELFALVRALELASDGDTRENAFRLQPTPEGSA